MEPYRIFLSYSHEDLQIAEKVAGVLEGLSLRPIWDKHIRPGTAFTDAIKGLIAHAHVFMPLITGSSRKRPWVHQETGYAMALNIPVLPIAVGNALGGEMIAQLQAIHVNKDLSDLEQRLGAIDFEHVVTPSPDKPLAMVEVADWPEQRVELIARYADRVWEIGGPNRVCQRGGLSSFSIPDTDIDDPFWKERDGDYPRSDYYHHLLRQERRALERHARDAGCDLLIDPTTEPSGGQRSRGARLRSLFAFLQSMPDDKIRIICSPRARDANHTIVGDWFVAESRFRLPGQGWRHTVFSWHAPTALHARDEFNQLLESLLSDEGHADGGSRRAAIEKVEAEIVGLSDR